MKRTRTVADVAAAVKRIAARREESRQRLEALAVTGDKPSPIADLQELRPGDELWVAQGERTVRAVFRRWAENGQLVVGPARASGGGFSDYNLRVSSGAVLGFARDDDGSGELLDPV